MITKAWKQFWKVCHVGLPLQPDAHLYCRPDRVNTSPQAARQAKHPFAKDRQDVTNMFHITAHCITTFAYPCTFEVLINS